MCFNLMIYILIYFGLKQVHFLVVLFGSQVKQLVGSLQNSYKIRFTAPTYRYHTNLASEYTKSMVSEWDYTELSEPIL